MRSLLKFLYLLIICVGTTSCEQPADFGGSHAPLDLTFENKNATDIDDVMVYFGKSRCGAGVVGAGFSATRMGWHEPVTSNAIVRWRDSQDKHHEQTVSLLGVYNPKADGRLFFSITGSNVLATFKAKN